MISRIQTNWSHNLISQTKKPRTPFQLTPLLGLTAPLGTFPRRFSQFLAEQTTIWSLTAAGGRHGMSSAPFAHFTFLSSRLVLSGLWVFCAKPTWTLSKQIAHEEDPLHIPFLAANCLEIGSLPCDQVWTGAGHRDGRELVTRAGDLLVSVSPRGCQREIFSPLDHENTASGQSDCLHFWGPSRIIIKS